MSETATPSNPGYSVEDEVRERYAEGAAACETSLCCPVNYDERFLQILPEEILERDYGCGDPSKWVEESETVLDLGSGGGKICYILSQKVGPAGRVIGVDFNDPMLELARKYQDEMAEKIGHSNVSFHKGRIQDLALDLDRMQTWLNERPIRRVEDQDAWSSECARLRAEDPMVQDASVDVVVSNCVLNLVASEEKGQLFEEIYRVLRNGGRAVISDIVCDEPPTDRILADPKLWSGCIAGAFTEHGFLERFERAGFHGVELLERSEEPWQVIDGIEFRAVTVRAYKGKEGPCLERNQAVTYRGPWSEVKDDDGHTFYRGKRMAVCEKTYTLMTDPSGPYAGQVVGIEPRQAIPTEEARPFACDGDRIRSPRETKGEDYRETHQSEDNPCEPGTSSCC